MLFVLTTLPYLSNGIDYTILIILKYSIQNEYNLESLGDFIIALTFFSNLILYSIVIEFEKIFRAIIMKSPGDSRLYQFWSEPFRIIRKSY